MKNARHPLRIFTRAKIESRRDLRHTALVCALVIASLSLAGDIKAQISISTKQPDTASDTGAARASRAGSTVRGRVVYDDTERPLRRVQVRIYDPGGDSNRQQRTAWTDGNGEFILKDVAAGKYYVLVDAPGIIRQEAFNAEDDLSELATASVNGINSAEVKVRVRRGGVISGKVSYADGDPVIGASVSVTRRKNGKMLLFYIIEDCGNGIQTDERGFYRVSGLPPGEYFVGAAEQKIHEISREQGDGTVLHRALLATTYYDGGTTIRNATPVEVDAGNETNNINIILIERNTHRISGTLVMRGTGLPVTRAMVSLEGKDETGTASSYLETQSADLNKQGQWSLDDIVDGTYTLIITPMRDQEGYSVRAPDSRVRSGGMAQPFIVKRQDVTVGGTDVTGLVIELSTGGRINGTVTVEGNRPLPPNLTISLEAASGERGGQYAGGVRVRPDGTFTADGIPSDGIWIRAHSWQDNKYYTKSVTLGSVDLMTEPLIVKDGSEVKGVRVVISPEMATLTGRVLASEGGAPLRSATIRLIPAELHKQRVRTAWLHGFTNAEGGFTINGAPGEYMVIISRPGMDHLTFSDQGFKALMANAQRVTLQANDRKKMDFVAPAH